jgi:hypothetical protein
VHRAAGDAYNDDEDTENNKEENPETGKSIATLYYILVIQAEIRELEVGYAPMLISAASLT